MALDSIQSLYRCLVVGAVDSHENGDSKSLDRLCEWMAMSNEAQTTLRGKGYGVTGQNILETAREVPPA